MMKIFLATSVHYWDDIRILRKEGVSLARRYEVELHAPAPFKTSVYKGVKIYGLPSWKKRRDRRAIRREIHKRIRHSDAGVVHFHDPELLPLALLTKLIYRKKVIYDVHEDYTAQIRNKTWIPGPLRPVLAGLYWLIESLAGRYCDHLIVASPAIQQKFAADSATLVSNYPRFDGQKGFPEKGTGAVQFVYAGSMVEVRGIREMGRAFIRLAESSAVKVNLQIAGPIGGSEDFQSSVRELFQHPAITYHGTLAFEEAQKLMDRCHVGIIPFLPSTANLNIVPHKLFDYMAAGLAVLASDFPGWPQEILKYDIGALFDPRDISSFTGAMRATATMPDELLIKGRRAFKLVRAKFTWDSQETQLFNAYQEVIGSQ